MFQLVAHFLLMHDKRLCVVEDSVEISGLFLRYTDVFGHFPGLPELMADPQRLRKEPLETERYFYRRTHVPRVKALATCK